MSNKLHKFMGYAPFYLGIFYGDGLIMGGEAEFNHCADFRPGVADTEWWLEDEIAKLTDEQRERLAAILRRNYMFYNFFSDNATSIADLLNISHTKLYLIHRLSSLEKVRLLYTIDKIKESNVVFEFIEDHHIDGMKMVDIAPDFMRQYATWSRRNYKPAQTAEEVPNFEELDPNWLKIINPQE